MPEGLGLASDDPGNVWGAFVGRLAEHYAAMGVHEWVIYARPNVRPGEGAVGFAGTEVDYARMLVVAREAARAVDPAAQIHVAAADWWIDVAAGRAPYLARLMAVFEAQDAEGASTEAFDAVWVRVASRTDDLDRLLTSTRAILDATGRTDAAVWLEANAGPDIGYSAGGGAAAVRRVDRAAGGFHRAGGGDGAGGRRGGDAGDADGG